MVQFGSSQLRGENTWGAMSVPDDFDVTFLFSDVVGFTRMTERLGDFAAHRVMARHRAFAAETEHRHGGETREIRGDGFLLALAAPDEILVSARVRELLDGRAEFRTHAGWRVSLEGFASRQQVFALDWAGEPPLAAATGW